MTVNVQLPQTRAILDKIISIGTAITVDGVSFAPSSSKRGGLPTPEQISNNTPFFSVVREDQTGYGFGERVGQGPQNGRYSPDIVEPVFDYTVNVFWVHTDVAANYDVIEDTRDALWVAFYNTPYMDRIAGIQKQVPHSQRRRFIFISGVEYITAQISLRIWQNLGVGFVPGP